MGDLTMMASLTLASCFVFFSLMPVGTLCTVIVYPDDPYSELIAMDDFVADEEPYTNLTIDEVISQTYGGSEAYMSDHFMNPDGIMLAELDMRLDMDQYNELYSDFARRKKRKATRPMRLRWTNGVVPYAFVTSHFSASEVYTIKQALQEWTDATCLTFRPAQQNDRNRIRFQNGAGCNSALGMVGGTQVINLQSPGCRYKGLYLHEVGHALGLVHEHQLPDRDEYITILYNNVSPNMRIWFNKYSTREVNQYGVPYEYSSVMHYGIRAFSRDGRAQTIRARDQSRQAEIGNVYRKGLSFSDIKVVNLMYECNKHCTPNPSCREPGYLDKSCQCVCPSNADCTTTTTTTTTGCDNVWPGSQCDGWAGEGSCDNNPDWMTTYCRRSCNACPTVTPTTTTTTSTTTVATTPETTTYMPSPPPSSPQTTTAVVECTNSWSSENDCVYWASIGECDNNPDWMRVNCQSSCNACPTPTTAAPTTTTTTPTTTTTTTQASTTAPQGSTTSATATTTYMPSPPPSTTTTAAPTTAGPCVNSWGDYSCNNWAGSGECTNNPVWMRQNCRKACTRCGGGGGGGSRSCQDRNRLCNYWSQQNYCSSSTYMTTHCRRSCRLCS